MIKVETVLQQDSRHYPLRFRSIVYSPALSWLKQVISLSAEYLLHGKLPWAREPGRGDLWGTSECDVELSRTKIHRPLWRSTLLINVWHHSPLALWRGNTVRAKRFAERWMLGKEIQRYSGAEGRILFKKTLGEKYVICWDSALDGLRIFTISAQRLPARFAPSFDYGLRDYRLQP